MPRPSKKSADERNKAPATLPTQVMMPHAAMPQGIPGMPQQLPQHHQQHHQQRPGVPQQQQQQMAQQQPPQVQMPHQQPPPPVGVPTMPHPGRVVDSESFLTVRDSAVNRLAAILELLRSFTTDYIRQTNLLLGEPTAEGTHGDLLSNFENAAAQLINPMADLGPPVEEKKERKKRTHDPNAPKRPLTPYFLYMQHARSIIANDLGPEAPKGAVQEEGQRRWASMNPDEKMGWNHAYQYNLRLYNARVHSYKSGNPDAKNMPDDEAMRYAEENDVPLPRLKEEQNSSHAAAAAAAAADEQDAIAQQLQQVAQAPMPTLADELAAGPDPSKTPKKNAPGRKRKTGEIDPAAAVLGSTMSPAGAPSSPDKKRRRASGKPVQDIEEPKKSGRKKTKN
ncbi:HMG (high mobility group) box [Geosmithia morbida]|uniref:HMG (High mobility group) box n=1 Tax=Geosmithia morbida TaxID=1094350 RepID=A0A9P4Z0H5_9HYPO|nr:HMG (high mobility group) box [Geosmithia morbida]KAF4125023.1 HMG (high mobility group) box [Geosmithia morbida]